MLLGDTRSGLGTGTWLVTNPNRNDAVWLREVERFDAWPP